MQWFCAEVDRYVGARIDIDVGEGVGIGDGEEVELKFGYEIDSGYSRSFNRGVKYGFGVIVGGSVYWYFEKSVGDWVDRDVGSKVGSGYGGVGWYFGRGVVARVGIGINAGVGSGAGIDRSVVNGSGSVDYEEI